MHYLPPRAFHLNWALRAPFEWALRAHSNGGGFAAPICGRRFAPFREWRFAPLAGAASPPPLLMIFINVLTMIVIVKIITRLIIIRLIVHWFIIIRLVLTKVIMECGFMMCPFGLPAKWLRKEGMRI